MPFSELIEALQIFQKYGNPTHPTHCEHDILVIRGIDPDDVSDEDKKLLEEKGFFIDDEYDNSFASYKYGSS